MTYPKNAHLKSPIIQPSCRKPLLEILATGPSTVKELAKKLKVTEETVSRNLRSMKGVRICAWQQSTKVFVPVWAIGDEPHETRPQLTPTEKSLQTMRQRRQGKSTDGSWLTPTYGFGERIYWGGKCL